jgi:hypothetical protein
MVSVGYAVGHAQAAALDFADSPLDCRSPRRRCPSLIIEPDEQPRSSALYCHPNGTVLPMSG